MTYTYKCNREGEICARNARCSVRGDLTRAGVQYDRTRHQCPTHEKATDLTHFGNMEAHGMGIEHMELLKAYVQAPDINTIPIYVREMPRSTGKYKYGKPYENFSENCGGGVD